MITNCHDIEGMDGITMRPYKKDSSYARTCPHNEGILCGNMKCAKCGWNPKVMEERRKHNG